jgi:hypothetical protein
MLTDSCTLLIRPSSLTFVKQRGWLKPKQLLQEVISVDPNLSQEVLIQKLADQLKKPEWRCSTNIILAGEYAKFRLVKQDSRLDQAESMALLRHQFAQIYDKQIQGWSIFLARPSFDKNNIACVVNQQLLIELQSVFQSAKVKLASAEVSLVIWLNKIRKLIPQDGWLAIVDVETVYALKLLAGEIVHLRELPMPNLATDNIDALEKMLTREMMTLGDDINTAKVSYYWVKQASLQPIFLQNKQTKVLSRHVAQDIGVAAI